MEQRWAAAVALSPLTPPGPPPDFKCPALLSVPAFTIGGTKYEVAGTTYASSNSELALSRKQDRLGDAKAWTLRVNDTALPFSAANIESTSPTLTRTLNWKEGQSVRLRLTGPLPKVWFWEAAYTVSEETDTRAVLYVRISNQSADAGDLTVRIGLDRAGTRALANPPRWATKTRPASRARTSAGCGAR